MCTAPTTEIEKKDQHQVGEKRERKKEERKKDREERDPDLISPSLFLSLSFIGSQSFVNETCACAFPRACKSKEEEKGWREEEENIGPSNSLEASAVDGGKTERRDWRRRVV